MYSAVRTMNKKIVVIGGGAAGLIAAAKTAEEGKQVILLEKLPKLGSGAGGAGHSAGTQRTIGEKTEYHRKGPVQRDQQYRY